MTEVSSIGSTSGYTYDYNLGELSGKDKNNDEKKFQDMLSAILTPPPPPPPHDHHMDLSKLSELISSSTSISYTDKSKILSLIEKISQYKKDNDADSILASIRSGKELTADQKKILDTLKTYQNQLGTEIKEVLGKNTGSQSATS